MKKTINVLISLAIVFFAGCGPMDIINAEKPDITSTEKKDGEKYSADEIRRITVDQPFLLSGDYFREREPDTQVNIDFTGGEAKKPAATNKAEDRTIAKAPSAVSEAGPVLKSPKDAPPLKVGFIFGKKTDADTARLLENALQKAGGKYPALLTGPAALLKALDGDTCPKSDNIACVVKSLGVYPGIRMLVVVDTLSLPKKAGGASFQAVAVDTGTGFQYPPFVASGEIATPPEIATFLGAVLENIVGSCLKRSEIIPWYCRAFSKEGNQIYVSAGGESKLKPGDRLKTLGPGKLVKSPGGMPAGWIPGSYKGLLKVDLLFGRDFAACSLVGGKPPGKEDMLVITK